MKKNIILNLFLSFGILILLVGCSSPSESEPQDKNITTIETVLKNTFTGPDQKLKNIWSDLYSDAAEKKDIEAAAMELNSYSDEKFKPYFAEEYYKPYISSVGFTFQLNAYWNDYELNVNKIQVETSEIKDQIYNFSLEVQFQNVENDNQIVEVTGQANINEDGLITNMLIHGNDLLEALEK